MAEATKLSSLDLDKVLKTSIKHESDADRKSVV